MHKKYGWCFNYHRIELPAYIKLPAVYVPTCHKHGYNSQPIPKGSNVLIIYPNLAEWAVNASCYLQKDSPKYFSFMEIGLTNTCIRKTNSQNLLYFYAISVAAWTIGHGVISPRSLDKSSHHFWHKKCIQMWLFSQYIWLYFSF